MTKSQHRKKTSHGPKSGGAGGCSHGPRPRSVEEDACRLAGGAGPKPGWSTRCDRSTGRLDEAGARRLVSEAGDRAVGVEGRQRRSCTGKGAMQEASAAGLGAGWLEVADDGDPPDLELGEGSDLLLSKERRWRAGEVRAAREREGIGAHSGEVSPARGAGHDGDLRRRVDGRGGRIRCEGGRGGPRRGWSCCHSSMPFIMLHYQFD